MTGKESKKKSRKGGAPLESAKSYKKGDKKKGTDGRLYYVNKGHRWSKVASSSTSKHKRGGPKKGTSSEKRRGKRYETHDNGGRPFAVYLDGSTAEVVRLGEDGEEEKVVYKTRYERAFVGKSKEHGKIFDGNTILLHLGGKKYVYTGEKVVSFSAKDEIVTYESPVGNSDVPYPFAIDRSKNVYLFAENVLLFDPPLEKERNGSVDPYSFYYGFSKDGGMAGLDKEERDRVNPVSFLGKTIQKRRFGPDSNEGVKPGVPIETKRKGGRRRRRSTTPTKKKRRRSRPATRTQGRT